MIYIVDTHIFIWFLDSNDRLSSKYRKILHNDKKIFIVSAMVLAEIKYLISIKRIKIDFDSVLEYVSECDNCEVYPIDEVLIDNMPSGLNIHDALIVATGLVYRNLTGRDLFILTEDKEIKDSNILPVA